MSIFISVDPLAEQTFSSYGYCYNNPINLVDPTGMEANDIIEIGKNSKYFNVTKAEGDDVVKLIEVKDGKKTTVDSYVYGKNGSFNKDAYVIKQKMEYENKLEHLEVHFYGGNSDKADTFYKFAAKSNFEFGLADVVYTNESCGETVVSSDYSRWKVGSYAYKALLQNADAIVKRVSHSHCDGVSYPSGFNPDLTPATPLDGDRENYVFEKARFKNRLPKYFEVYIPAINTVMKYNDKEVIIQKK